MRLDTETPSPRSPLHPCLIQNMRAGVVRITLAATFLAASLDLASASSTLRMVACRSSDGCCRVEVYHSGQWGTICDDSWDNNDALVACRQMGCGGGTGVQSFGGGSGPIWLDDVNCAASDSSIQDCGHSRWGSHNCGHSEDAGVCCRAGSGQFLSPGKIKFWYS